MGDLIGHGGGRGSARSDDTIKVDFQRVNGPVQREERLGKAKMVNGLG